VGLITAHIVRILAISGSLRAASINSALLRTVKRLAPPEIEITLCTVIGELPLFNPDLERSLPSAVAILHVQVSAADAILIASPEYAHGVTGTIKNALDWLVSFEPFVDKPVAVLSASPRAHHADLALRETLKTMSAAIVESASISFPLLGSGVTEQGMAQQAWIAHGIRESLAALYNVVESRRPVQAPSFPLESQ
jgi:chromate reductase